MTDPSSFIKQGKAKPRGQGKAKTKQHRKASPKMLRAVALYSDNLSNPRPKSSGEILRMAGYTLNTSLRPSDIIQSDTFQQLLEQTMPDNILAQTHKRLLETRKLEHMVFPLEHQDPSDLGHAFPLDEALREQEIADRRIIDNLSDEDIVDMLAEVNCKVKRIVHGDTARHVYFWAHDAKAQSTALELAYKLKGHLGKDGNAGGSFNFNLGTQNFVNSSQGVSK